MEKNTTGQDVAYIRVSTIEQNSDRQESIADGAAKVFREKTSAIEDAPRPELDNAIEWVRSGDRFIAWSIDRLARSIADLKKIAKTLREKGVTLHLVSENIILRPGEDADPYSELIFHIIGVVAEFETKNTKRRQREGIAVAKMAGKYRGQKPSLTAEQVEEIKKRVKEKAPKSEIARELGVDRTTIYRALKPDYVTREGWEALAGR